MKKFPFASLIEALSLKGEKQPIIYQTGEQNHEIYAAAILEWVGGASKP
jgi:hypothetical protein